MKLQCEAGVAACRLHEAEDATWHAEEAEAILLREEEATYCHQEAEVLDLRKRYAETTLRCEEEAAWKQEGEQVTWNERALRYSKESGWKNEKKRIN